MATQAAETKATRGDGPLSAMYIDGTNKEHKRVVAGVSQVKIIAKGGKTRSYSVSALSPAVREQLAAEALKKRMDIFARNTVKDDAGADVLLATDSVYNMLKDGVLYSRKEGGAGGPGKSFDFDRYITIIKNSVLAMEKAKQKYRDKDGNEHLVKALTDKQLADARAKAESMTPKDRNKMLMARRAKSPFFRMAEKQYDLEVAKADIADGNFDSNDLF